MENIELLEDNKTKNNQLEVNSAIFDNISKNINVQNLIDDGILKISEDVRVYLDAVGYGIDDILLLGQYEPVDDVNSIKLEFDCIGEFGINVAVKGKLYSSDVTIYKKTLEIINNKINLFFSDKSGFKSFYSQLFIAKQLGYKHVTASAVRGKNVSGYYYWPMLGFRADPDINISDLVMESDKIQINDCKTLNELFDLRDKNGNNIGIEFWKEHGFGFNAKFDLSDGSKSLERLNEYILSKKQSNPEKYKHINVIK